MKYYDVAISLGQYCITSTALRRNNLQAETMIFDWSAGILFDVCGLGGLDGKVNLICNDFKDFFERKPSLIEQIFLLKMSKITRF